MLSATKSFLRALYSPLPFKKCVTAYQSRFRAVKMDGAKAYYRDHGAPKGDLVGRRSAWVEAGS